MIRLQPVTEDNWRDTLKLAVHPTQQRFVADTQPIAAIALAKAYIRPLGMTWQPFAIYNGQQMIGFIELALKTGRFADCWIFHFFIDQHSQGRGYGKTAMQAVITMTKEKYRECRGLCLVVHPENLAAQRLYQQIGFIATGEERWGEPVYRLGFE